MLRDMARGMRGEDVRAVQGGLNEYFRSERKSLATDGIFGGETLAAVEAFQKRNPGTGRGDGTPDGIVGGRTRRKLFPLVPYSVSVTGFRLKLPSLQMPGFKPPRLLPRRLSLPGPPSVTPSMWGPFPPQLDFSKLFKYPPPPLLNGQPQKFRGLGVPIITPPFWVPPRVRIPPAPAPAPTPTLLPLNIHHFEFSPGVSVEVGKFGGPVEPSFSFAIQGVVLRGDDKVTHQEFAFGLEIASPGLDGSGNWSMAWYAQIADIDRLGPWGLFHLWQPYAQLGGDNTSARFRPVIKGGVFPINLGFDLNDNVSLSAGGGAALTYDPQNGRLTAGLEGSAGLVVKFDVPVKR